MFHPNACGALARGEVAPAERGWASSASLARLGCHGLPTPTPTPTPVLPMVTWPDGSRNVAIPCATGRAGPGWSPLDKPVMDWPDCNGSRSFHALRAPSDNVGCSPLARPVRNGNALQEEWIRNPACLSLLDVSFRPVLWTQGEIRCYAAAQKITDETVCMNSGASWYLDAVLWKAFVRQS